VSVVLPTSSRLGAESVCSAQTSVPRRELSVNTVLPSEAQFKNTNLKSLYVDYCTRDLYEKQKSFCHKGKLSLFWGYIFSYTADPSGHPF